MTTVVVGMSGGVDSSVAAALLVKQGYRVIGLMLRLWSEPGKEGSNRCCTPDAMAQARRVAAQLGIPFYAIDAQEPFRQAVVERFLGGYALGVTPNPCLHCNRHIRWGLMLNHARSLGADFLATGHYARLEKPDNGPVRLLKAIDPAKDQTYVLSVLNQEQLRATLLPLGGYSKPQVRELARELGLVVAERADSQDLCFLAGGDYREFLQRYVPDVSRPGAIVDRQGRVLGQHEGLAFYTIGQRKGIKIAAPEPYYVLAKDAAANALVVGTLSELGKRRLVAGNANWVAGDAPPGPFAAMIKIRYRAAEASGTVTPLEGGFTVDFDQPMRDITPGQSAVIFSGEECLGGGIIQAAA